MEIHNIIAHEVIKVRDGQATIKLKPNELDRTGVQVSNLTIRILNLFATKAGLAHGTFKQAAAFHGHLDSFNDEKTGFSEFSSLIMSVLKDEIDRQSLATGGFMLIAYLTNNQERSLLTVMLKNTEGLSFNDYLDVIDVKHINLEKLHLAALINISRWRNMGTTEYISFVRGRHNQRVADYFARFIGVQFVVDSRQSTDTIVNAVINFLSENPQRYNEATVEQIRNRCFQYLKDRAETKAIVYTDDFSAHIDPDNPETFLTYINQQQQIGTQFYVDKNRLKPLVKYSGEDASLRIQFSHEAFGNRITYNAEANTLTIRNVPRNLREQLTLFNQEAERDTQNE